MTVNCTSDRGTIGYSAGPFSRVQFAIGWNGLRTFTRRNPLYRQDGPGVRVNTVFTEEYRGQFRELFVDTADLLNPGA
jgi:hypothetical protein